MKFFLRLLAATLLALAGAAVILALAPLVAMIIATRIVIGTFVDARPAAFEPPAVAAMVGRTPAALDRGTPLPPARRGS